MTSQVENESNKEHGTALEYRPPAQVKDAYRGAPRPSRVGPLALLPTHTLLPNRTSAMFDWRDLVSRRRQKVSLTALNANECSIQIIIAVD